MSSLIKRPGSSYYFACFDLAMPDGSIRRLKKSTKCTKRSDAIVEAQRLEELARKEAGGVGLPKANKAYEILTEAADAAAKGELSEARSRALIAQLAELSTGSAFKFYTVRQWAEEWLEMKAAIVKPGTQAHNLGHIKSFLVWLGKKADDRLEAVTKADMRGFRDAIRSGWNMPDEARGKKLTQPTERRKGKTTNQFLRCIAGMFRAAVREGILVVSPCATLEQVPETDSMEREVFTLAEISALVETAKKPGWQKRIFRRKAVSEEEVEARSRDWEGMVLIGFYIGPRIGDGARLTWSSVNLDDMAITFTPAKTEKKLKNLRVPIHPRLGEWLRQQRRRHANDVFVFPALHRMKVTGKAGLSSQFIAIMEEAEIDRRQVQGLEPARRAQHTRSFHAMRHSLTSAMANLDISAEVRRKIVGHKSVKVHEVYTHHETQVLALAVGKLPRV